MNEEYHSFFKQGQNDLLDFNNINIKGMDRLISDTRRAYEVNVQKINDENPIHVTDTLASKILLGVYGNVPAYDRFFHKGLTLFNIRTQFDEWSLKELTDFYHLNIGEFDSSRTLFSNDGVGYTPMKLVDMFFWQIGFMMDQPELYKEEIIAIEKFAEQYQSTNRKRKLVTGPPYQKSYERVTRNIGLTDEIRHYIISTLNSAKIEGKEFLDLRSGDIHKALGLKDRLPPVCNAMESLGVYRYTILRDTPSGKSSTKVVRYYLV